jgi:hypothetical protein
MNEIELLIQKYEEYARLPWDSTLAGPQKVWFAIYDPVMKETELQSRF